MCDLDIPKTSLNPDDGVSSSLTATVKNHIHALDNISVTSDCSMEQAHQQQLHQTTQSLLMASSLMTGVDGGGKDLHSETVLSNVSSLPGCVLGFKEPMGINTIKINIEELLRENFALREQIKKIITDRDRLLCEVSNLRLELDMSELKRFPEESFPQKVIDRSNSVQYGIAAPSESSSSVDGGYIYLQQQVAPSTGSSNSSFAIKCPPPSTQQQQHMIHPHYPTRPQQPVIHQSTNVACGSSNISSLCSLSSSSGGACGHFSPQQHLVLHGHHHHNHHGGAVVIAGSGVGIGGASCSAMQQNLHKKNSVRNGSEVLKRSRAQTAYELSQDLLEKQIELLERKYGGVCARNAATTIQRAFRHYMMVKKFASITAMAKAEKRLSRRMLITSANDGPVSNNYLSSAYACTSESPMELSQISATSHSPMQQQQPRVTIMAGPPGIGANSSSSTGMPSALRTAPTRSLSLRERRQLDLSHIPRSHSGASSAVSTFPPNVSATAAVSLTHPHVNLLHAVEAHNYGCATVVTAGGQCQQFYPVHCGRGAIHHAIPNDTAFGSIGCSSTGFDSPLNTSWVSVSDSGVSAASPHTPYYSAAQIYMRPKALTSHERKKVPPEVPKRTSSITAQQQAAQQQHQQLLMMRQTPSPAIMRSNGLCKTAENGSLISVQSSGSDSSVTSTERTAVNSDLGSDRSNSPNTWKRGTNLNSSNQFSHAPDPTRPMSTHQIMMDRGTNLSVMVSAAGAAGGPSDENVSSSHTSAAQYGQQEQQDHQINVVPTTQNYKVSETIRKRQYRVGLNLFNKKPDKGITYLIRRGFLENTPQGVARFLISRKGLSRQMIGEYLGNLQNQFNMAVLNCFSLELDLSGMQVDVALRKFQAYFRMPGEAQKIERLMEVFSHRYCQCNQDIVGRLRSSDTIFVLAFAIIMLNTDLHTPNLKPERRMRVEDFIKNLRGIDDCHDIDKDMLSGIYERVKSNEFKPGSDHVTQVMKVQATIVGKKPNLALPHRRLVCYCRLYEIPDINKKERPGVHQREVFLFNDLLVITKIFSKKKSSVTYTFRNTYPLCGMVVTLVDVPNYPFCIQLSQKVDGKNLITFNARNEHDRCKFAEDLKESISEMDEMEALRIEAEFERQKSARNRATGGSENRDSGVADVEVCPCPFQTTHSGGGQPNRGAIENPQQLKRSALSNSLLDMHEQCEIPSRCERRGSVGSLDSGMSISFQSTTTSSVSRENAVIVAAAANAAAVKFKFPSAAPAGSALGAVVGTAFQMSDPNASHAYSQHLLYHQQSNQQAQQPQITCRVTCRDRRLSRSDENGRSTDV